MLLVRTVTGPDHAETGDALTYQVVAFSQAQPDPAEAARVSWLVKSADGSALTHISQVGPKLELTVPASWGDTTALVMPYMASPSSKIAVRTAIAAAPPAPGEAIEEVEVIREDRRYYASVDGAPRFYVGTDVPYGTRRGLMNWANAPGARYLPEEFEAAHGDWAWYLLPTATCESRRQFTCLNTYDRAAFTFGFYQFAAHTPDDNFVAFLRKLLALPLAPAYFPDLTLANGRIHLRTAGGLTALESAASSAGLMDYFNSTEKAVDNLEAERAARMVDWCVRDAAARNLQVSFAVDQQRRKLAAHAQKLPLHRLVDKLCLVVLDVLHQGRASYKTIGSMLAAADPFDALLTIGASTYRDRVATLRAGIRDLETAGRVGRKVYDKATNRFVEPDGA